MAKYDIENLLADIQAFLQSNLNAKLSAISAEKADGVNLPLIDSNAYFLQTFNDKNASYDPFVFYGIDKVEGDASGPYASRNYKLNVIIIASDQGQDLSMPKRMLRYSRALDEIFSENWATIGAAVKFRVTSLEPISFTMMNSSEPYRAIGVTLEAPLAG